MRKISENERKKRSAQRKIFGDIFTEKTQIKNNFRRMKTLTSKIEFHLLNDTTRLKAHFVTVITDSDRNFWRENVEQIRKMFNKKRHQMRSVNYLAKCRTSLACHSPNTRVIEELFVEAWQKMCQKVEKVPLKRARMKKTKQQTKMAMPWPKLCEQIFL